MELGTRNIRSAGHGSGSIEVTLPSPLRDMAGLPCRIALRDGLRPEIVLVPDMRPAREAMQRLWNLLAIALAAPLGTLPLAGIGIALLPDAGLDRLGWVDAIALAKSPPHMPEQLCRPLRAMALQAARALELREDTAPAFAAAVAHAVTGLVALPADQEACDIAAALVTPALITPTLVTPAGTAGFGDDAFDPVMWSAMAPLLRQLLELHQDLDHHPERLGALRRAWRHGVALELTGD